MTDIGLSLLITRDLLSKAVLELNDHTKFIVANQLLGGSVSWDRRTAKSPWVEGEVVLTRTRGLVMEPVGIYVIGSSHATMMTNLDELLEAFTQDGYSLQMTIGTSPARYWYCEAADYQVQWTNTGVVAHQMTVSLQVPRQPLTPAGMF